MFISMFICWKRWLIRLLTQTHGAALAVDKWRAGTGHCRACNLVAHDLGLLPPINVRVTSGSLTSTVHRYMFPLWLGTTWQVHLVQLSTTQSSLSSNSRPSCQHMFFSLVFFILPRASFMTEFSSVWTHNNRQICSQGADQSEKVRTNSRERCAAFHAVREGEGIHLLTRRF